MKTAHAKKYEQWLKHITAIPTAAGREQRVIAWIKDWVGERRNLTLREDPAGNLLIQRKANGRMRTAARPLYITAHLDHPAFVVRDIAPSSASGIELEFRGGVNDPYFDHAAIEIIDSQDRFHAATITSLDSKAQPFKRVLAKLVKPATSIRPGDVARWRFAQRGKTFQPHIADGLLHTHACDDLAAVAAALATLDALDYRRDAAHVGVLFTRSEEIGFIGAIAACKHKTVSKQARLICLENSRSFPDSPIGAGPIVRVGDKMSVFGPSLTNRISLLMMEHQRSHPDFKWQRKLMPGGTCEATTFTTYGYESTCLCLPLGNYHNMSDIDGVASGKRPAKVGPEFIAISDFHGLIEMLVICATELDSAKLPSLKQRMEQLYAAHRDVL